MEWTITVGQKTVNPTNGNITIPVTATDENGRVLNRTFGPSNTLTPDDLRVRVKAWLQEIELSDTNAALLAAVEGQTITTQDPAPVDPALVTFRQNWQRLKRLLSLQSAKAATVTKIGQLRTAIEDALTANPTWIDDDRIG